MPLEPGAKLGAYEILSLIGAGGMGEVYRARDPKLSRDVAIKVLPSGFTDDVGRRARLDREAKSLAALNHPNIVHVYSVDEADGVHFITMELVEGKSLAELIPKRGLSPEAFQEMAVPLAQAVAAAHEHGLTHRDLKPPNIMVTDDGIVKVLDFGLAKLRAGFVTEGTDSESPTLQMTQAGQIVGTPHYMSPEQAEGKALDHRSDIFSLGVIFSEMLTGRRPFEGDTPAAVISAILERTPPSVGGSLLVERLVKRCLEKSPQRRYQSARDVALELESLPAEPDLSKPATKTRSIWPATTTVLALALVTTIVAWNLGGFGEQPVPKLANPTQLTSSAGVEDYPAWSPDGAMLAYAASERGTIWGGDWDILVRQLGDAAPINRTSDYEGDDRLPAWSPDGSQIAFWSSRDEGGYYIMPALAGPPRRVSPPRTSSDFMGAARPQWSSDGVRLAYADRESLRIVNLRTGDVSEPQASSTVNELSWSPDDAFIVYRSGGAGNDTSTLWSLRLADGKEQSFTDAQTLNRSPSWSSDARALFFISDRGGTTDLWMQSWSRDGPEGVPRPVTVGVGIRHAVFSPDATRLAYSRGRRVTNVWRVPILESHPATWDVAEQLTFARAHTEFIDVSPDGKQLAFSSDRSGAIELWLSSTEELEPRQLTTESTADWDPHFSPDGNQIVFYSHRSGNRDLWAISIEGGAPRQLTMNEATDSFPTWSPDGEQVAFISARQGTFDLWSVSSSGGEPRRLSDERGQALYPDWSPDGRWIVMEVRADNTGIWRVPSSGGQAERLTAGGAPRWSPDGRTIFFVGSGSKGGDIWALSPSTGVERQMTDLSRRPGGLTPDTLATDGNYLYFVWEESLGDIWVMDVE